MANIDLEHEFSSSNQEKILSTSMKSHLNEEPGAPKHPDLKAIGTPISNSSTNSHENPNWGLRKRIFCLFLYVTIFTNFDTGVIPAALININKEMGLNFEQQGLLGSLPYFGISTASFFVSYLVGKVQTKYILSIAIFLNVCFCLLFSLSTNVWALYFSRFFMGFTQAFWVIYAPVWTNYFSPFERQTTWLGLLQGFSPLGIIAGYLSTAVIINVITETYAWRLSILIQAGLEIPIIFLIFLMKNSDLDMFEHQRLNEEIPEEVSLQRPTSLAQIKQLLKNKIFMLASFTVCVAFFVVVGIQFWGTSYMILTMDVSPHNAMITYAFITITAPILGVVFSGFIMDVLGGYKGNNRNIAFKVMLCCTVVSMIIAIPTSFVYNIFLFAPLLWLEIFCGACNVPPGIGIVVDSVDLNMQHYASSFSQFIYNMCGYFLSPIFSAGIMDSFDDRVEGMKWGFRMNQFISIFAVIFVVFMMFIASSALEKPPNKLAKGKENSANASVDTSFEERRKLLRFEAEEEEKCE